MQNSNLRVALLSNADLTGADLRGDNLGGARLNHAVLFKADFRGTNLTGLVIDEQTLQISGILYGEF